MLRLALQRSTRDYGGVFESYSMQIFGGDSSVCALRPVQSETEFTMNTYVASIGGKSVLAFRAEDDDQARAIIDDPEGSMRSDLQLLVGTDGKPLWDGKSAIQVREANAAQHAEWEQSRDLAISDGEIDLDAGNDPDEWNVYLIGIPRTKKA
jgi:hypothetical protein